MRKIALFLGISLSLFMTNNALACTDIRVKANDGSLFIARSMEYSVDMKSNLRSSTQGRSFSTLAPDGKPGLSWKAKYGYVYLDAFNIDVALDGMNEAGLSIENLYLPGYAAYQTVPSGEDNQALPYLNLADWVLGNFKSIDVHNRQHRSTRARIQKLITVPGRGRGPCFRFPIAHHRHRNQIGIIEHSTKRCRQTITQFTSFQNRPRHSGRHMAGKLGVWPTEIVNEFSKAHSITRIFRIKIRHRSFQK